MSFLARIFCSVPSSSNRSCSPNKRYASQVVNDDVALLEVKLTLLSYIDDSNKDGSLHIIADNR